MIHIPWVEKYRPKKLDDLISQDTSMIREIIKDPMSMPHFLLVSRSPGTGKSSLAQVIRNEIKSPKGDYLVMNSSEERKIETIRTTVKNFVRTKRIKQNTPRIIQMDEFDGMLTPSQDAMRNLMETHSRNCKFILTANNASKIIDPIKSRCATILMSDPPKDKIIERLQFILKEEHIQFDTEGLETIVNTYYPDMRSMINKLQELSFSDNGITKDILIQRTQSEEEFYELLKANRNVYECRKFVIDNNVDVDSLLKLVIDKSITDPDIESLFINSAEYRVALTELTLFGAEINYRMMVGSDKDIQMLAFILKYLQVIPKPE